MVWPSFSDVPPALWGLYAVLFLEILGASLTIPIFNFFCIVELKLTATYVGIIVACFNGAQLLGAPIVGRISDAVGRRLPLLMTFLWTAFCFALTALATTFWQLLTIRTLAGLSGGSVSVTQAMIIDVSTTKNRPFLLGLTGAVLGVAFTIGPALVTMILTFVDIERRYVFLLASVFAFLGCLVGAFVLKESLDESKRQPLCADNGDAGAVRSWTNIVAEVKATSSKGLVCVWSGRFFFSYALLTLFTTYAFLIRKAFAWGDQEFGMVLACAGVCGGVLQLAVYPAFSRAIGKHMVCVVGALLAAAHFILLPWASLAIASVSLHIVAMALFILGSALVDPGIPDLVGVHAPAAWMGMAQGITTACRSSASIFAPVVSGIAYDASPYYAYIAAAAAAAVSAACFFIAWYFVDPEEASVSDKLLQDCATPRKANYSA